MADLYSNYADQKQKNLTQKPQQLGLSQALAGGGTGANFAAAGSQNIDSGFHTNGFDPHEKSQMDPNYKQTFGTDQNPGGNFTSQAVNGNGTIPQPAAPQPVQAQMPQQSAPIQVDTVKQPTIPAGGPATVAPPAPDPNALPAGATDFGNGMVKFADGQVLPRNHPAYAAKVAALQPAAPASPGAPAGAPGSAPPPEAYGASADTNASMHDLVNKLLANPSSMSDQYVSQLKEVGKEQSTGLADQLQHKLKMDAAARGVTGGGNESMRAEKIGEAMNSDILKGYRDVDMQKAATDRSDLLNAMGFGEQYNKDAQGNYFANLDAKRAQDALALQDKLGSGSLANEGARLGESSREFDLSHALALKQFMENQRQFNGQLGYNYNNLDQQGQLSTLSQLAGLF